MNKEEVLCKIIRLMKLYEEGRLGGEKMPEDENPALPKDSLENYLYFTLPMALNYQRNSYVLWECAHRCFLDEDTRNIFDPAAVVNMAEDELRYKLTKHKVALQPNKQPIIWKTLCTTIVNQYQGDLRRLFQDSNYCVKNIKVAITANKKAFPYLGGNKIMNYWLYVIEQYTAVQFKDRENITVAPDTHIIQASEKLGVITAEEKNLSTVQKIVSDRWLLLLENRSFCPIDVHTPMWLWSRGKFSVSLA